MMLQGLYATGHLQTDLKSDNQLQCFVVGEQENKVKLKKKGRTILILAHLEDPRDQTCTHQSPG